MKKTILELSNVEARDFFLQASKYCTIDLPKYFDFQPLLNNLERKIGNKKLVDIKSSVNAPKDCEGVNYRFLTNKDGNFAWRPLQIINPAVYICLVNRITETDNWILIQQRFKKFQENENIICCGIPIESDSYSDDIKEDIRTNILNWWEEVEQKSIELALEYDCVLITDITDCYGSIYTHSIGWALHGKIEAREHRNVNPPTLIGCIIDDIIQAMSYRQTNGIPQGSVLMDFIAEMVLGYADMQLSDAIKEQCDGMDYKIIRYRDDYRIFAHTQEDAVKLAKILSEVLSDLNFKLNTQKTFVSNNIIRSVIKEDKLYWNSAKQECSTLQKQLLLIYDLSEKYPNSGSISTALSAFIDKLTPLKCLNEDNSQVLISILIDIAYKNPRTYSAVVVCLGIIMNLETNKDTVEKISNLIKKKFSNKSNVGYWEVWFQRLTIKTNRGKDASSKEKLCQIAANNSSVGLWNNDWLDDEYKNEFISTSIINETVLSGISEVPKKEEAQLFGY